MKKFKANNFRIEEYEIIRETEKQIIIIDRRGRECRQAKITSFDSWHDTKEDAINYLVSQRQKEIEIHFKSIEYLKAEIDKIYKF